MIVINDFRTVSQFELEINDYLPFSFRCYDAFDNTPLYWRAGDFKYALVEVGINQTTGAIFKVVVPLISNFSEYDPKTILDARFIGGIPICDTSSFSGNAFQDEVLDISFQKSEDCVVVYFSADRKVHIVYSVGETRFLVDEAGLLMGITFSKLSSQEINMVVMASSSS